MHRRNSYTPLSSYDQVKRPRLYSAGNQPWLPLAPTPSALMPEGRQSQVSHRVTGSPSKSVAVNCKRSHPTTVVTVCLAPPCLSFGSSRWFSVCVATDAHEIHLSISLSLSGHVLNGWPLSFNVLSDVCFAWPLPHHWAVPSLNMQNSMSTFCWGKLISLVSLYWRQKTHKQQSYLVQYFVINDHVYILYKS